MDKLLLTFHILLHIIVEINAFDFKYSHVIAVPKDEDKHELHVTTTYHGNMKVNLNLLSASGKRTAIHGVQPYVTRLSPALIDLNKLMPSPADVPRPAADVPVVTKIAATRSIQQRKTYRVKVYTGGQEGASTNANVYMIMFGEKGNSGRLPLKKTLSSLWLPFLRPNSLDTFDFNLEDLGNLYMITIGHDSTGPRAAWHLFKVVIKHLEEEYLFHFDDWIAKNFGPRKLDVDIFVEGYQSNTGSDTMPLEQYDLPVSFLLLQSSGHTTVVMYSEFGDQQLLSNLFYPAVAQSYKYIVYRTGDLESHRIMAIALEEGQTNVKIISDMENIEKLLQRDQVISSNSTALDSGTLVLADKTIAVFSISQRVQQTGSIVSSHIALDRLSDSYITPPTLAVDPNSLETNSYLIMTAYANTVIQTTVPGFCSLTLVNEGHMESISIAANAFHRVYANKPFYLARQATTDPASSDSCPTTLEFIPPLLWRTHYTFTVSKGLARSSSPVYIVIISGANANMGTRFFNQRLQPEEMSCTNGNIKACYFRMAQGVNMILLKISRSIAAYMFGKRGDKSFCHPMGVSTLRSDARTVDYSWQTYRKHLKTPAVIGCKETETTIPPSPTIVTPTPKTVPDNTPQTTFVAAITAFAKPFQLEKTHWVKRYSHAKNSNHQGMAKGSESASICAISCETSSDYNTFNYSEKNELCICLKGIQELLDEDLVKDDDWDIWHKRLTTS